MAENFSSAYFPIRNLNVTLRGNYTSAPSVEQNINELLFDINYRANIYLLQPAPIIAIVLACIGITFNLLSVVALCHIPSRLNTHYRLILSISISDALIGLTNLLHIVNKVLNPSLVPGSGSDWDRIRSRCPFVLIKALNTTSLNISLLTLMGMSVDHYTAITKPLRYQKLLGKRRARMMIICLWLVAIICGFSDFFTPISFYISEISQPYNYCELIWISEYHEEYSVFVIAFLCFFVMLFIYVRIYIKVRHHKLPGEECFPNGNNKKDDKRNRRALITTLLILGSFIICWLPTCLFQITMLILVKNGITEIDEKLRFILTIADKFLYNLLLLNCICDPAIYTIRCKEVRLGYKKLCCLCNKDGAILSLPSLKSSVSSRIIVDKSNDCTCSSTKRRLAQQLSHGTCKLTDNQDKVNM